MRRRLLLCRVAQRRVTLLEHLPEVGLDALELGRMAEDHLVQFLDGAVLERNESLEVGNPGFLVHARSYGAAPRPRQGCVLAGALDDDGGQITGMPVPAAQGHAFYDLVTIGDATLQGRKDTTRLNF